MRYSRRRLSPCILLFPWRPRSLGKAALAAWVQRRHLYPGGSACQNTNTALARRWNFFPTGASTRRPKAATKLSVSSLERAIVLSIGSKTMWTDTSGWSANASLVRDNSAPREYRREAPYPPSDLLVAKPFSHHIKIERHGRACYGPRMAFGGQHERVHRRLGAQQIRQARGQRHRVANRRGDAGGPGRCRGHRGRYRHCLSRHDEWRVCAPGVSGILGFPGRSW